MGLDFTTPDSDTVATPAPAPKWMAIVMAVIAAALAGTFLFGASPTGASGPEQRPALSIPLSIPWDTSVTYLNASGETQDMTMWCSGFQRDLTAPWEALSEPSVGNVRQQPCFVAANLSSAYDLHVLANTFVWCVDDGCTFQVRPGDHVEIAMKPPVDARPPLRQDLSAPYLGFATRWTQPQLPGVTEYEALDTAHPYLSVAIDPGSLEIVQGPEHADAWVTPGGKIAVKLPAGVEVPLDELRYRLCGENGHCAEADLYLPYAQAPNPVDGTWRVPAEANPGLGWLDDSDPNGYPFAFVQGPTFDVVDAPDVGRVEIDRYGRFAYFPQAGFKGVDRFVYRVCDTQALCGDATVTLLVGGADDPDPQPADPEKKPEPLTPEEAKKIGLDKLAEPRDEPIEELPVRDLLIEYIEGPVDHAVWTGESSTKAAAVAAECTITGTEGDDVLVGTPGPDVICGLGGDDIIVGKGGNDVLRGGPGEDQLDGGSGHDHLFGGSGRDELLGKGGADRLRGGTGPDDLRGGKGADRMWGNAGEDVLRGNAGPDRLRGGKGDDIILGGAGADIARGGAGADRIRGGTGDDDLNGNAGRDVVFGNAGNDRVRGGAGEDLLGRYHRIR